MRKFKKAIYCLIAFPIFLPPFLLFAVLRSVSEQVFDWLEDAVTYLKDALLETDYSSREAFKLFSKMYNRYIEYKDLRDDELEDFIIICHNGKLEAEEEQDRRKAKRKADSVSTPTSAPNK